MRISIDSDLAKGARCVSNAAAIHNSQPALPDVHGSKTSQTTQRLSLGINDVPFFVYIGCISPSGVIRRVQEVALEYRGLYCSCLADCDRCLSAGSMHAADFQLSCLECIAWGYCTPFGSCPAEFVLQHHGGWRQSVPGSSHRCLQYFRRGDVRHQIIATVLLSTGYGSKARGRACRPLSVRTYGCQIKRKWLLQCLPVLQPVAAQHQGHWDSFTRYGRCHV